MRIHQKVTSLLFIASFPILMFGQAQERVSGRLLLQKTRQASDTDIRRAISDHGASTARYISQLGVYVVSVPEAALQRRMLELNNTGLFTYAETDGLARGGSVPNDPGFPSQWHLGTINAAAAWNITIGSPSVPIAMIDSGVNPTHPDLASKLIPGWSFLLSNTNTADVLGHGTATAGVAAAATNNGVGVAGVGWMNPIMPLVVLDSSDYATYSDIASAITYAADHGVRIINVSIGGSTSSSTLQSAVNYAWNKGAVVFASAMNSSTSAPYYPAACEYVVAVSATEPGDTLAGFSDFGSWISLSAPGDNIYTTDNSGAYSTWAGTSFSSPIAAATGALVLSINPSLSAQGLVTLLEQNSDDIGAPGFDTSFGWGRINAYKAAVAAEASLSAVPPPPAVAITSPSAGATISGIVQVAGTATDSAPVTTAQLFVDSVLEGNCASVSFSCSWNTASVAAGTHTLTVKACVSGSNCGSASETVITAAPPVTPPDTIPPTVQILSPATGTTVSGNINVQVAATDNVGVTQLCVYVDGVLKTTLKAAPYSYQWNTKKVSAGSHTITAKAWDAAGNNTSTSIAVNVK